MRSKFKWIFTLLVALTMQFSFAQEKTVKGIVTDANGSMPGVNVLVKGTQRGVATGFDGSYSIKASVGEVLVFSFMGMNDISRTVDASGVINVKMQDDTKVLTEVVVTSMGIKKRPDATTTNNKILKTKELTQAANPSVIQSLNGKVVGLQISNISSGVDSNTRIQLRGIRSIGGSNEALVVIDGAISSAALLAQMPPEIVETVNVIKGAQGAALYGEQGANGVIIVNTKKGAKSSKMTVDLSNSIDFETISFLPERQTEYGQGWNTDPSFSFGGADPRNNVGFVPWENGSWGPAFNDPAFAGTTVPVGLPQADGSFITTPWESRGSDNVKDFFKTGVTLQNSVTINMGGENGYTLLNLKRETRDFIIDGDALKRTSFLFKAGKSFNKFSIDGSVGFTGQSTTEAANANNSIFDDLLQSATNIPVGNFANSGHQNNWTVYAYNPYRLAEQARSNVRSNNFNGSLVLDYKFTKNISTNYRVSGQLRSSNSDNHDDGVDVGDTFYDFTAYGYDYGGNVTETYADLGGQGTGSTFYESKATRRNLYSTLMLNFDYDLTDNINFKLNLGNDIQDNFYTVSKQGGKGLDVPGFYHISNVLNADLPTSNGTGTPLDNMINFNKSETLRRVGNFYSADLALKDYLFLNTTGRLEQTSNIKGSFFYPSVGMSFVPTKAFGALKDGRVLNFMKISGNYTQNGNTSAVPVYETNALASAAFGFPYGNLAGFRDNLSPTDVNSRPEKVSTTELNLGLGFFNNRVTFEGSVYKATTKDLISRISTSNTSGTLTKNGNIGSLENKGFEIELGLIPVRNENFTWSMNAGYTTFKTVITSLAEGNTSVDLQSNAQVGIFAEVGEEFPIIKGTAYIRDPSGNIVVDANGFPLRTSTFEKLGKSLPDYILNFSNTFNYKGIGLTAVMDYRTGASIWSGQYRRSSVFGYVPESAGFDRNVGYVVPNSVIETSPGVYTENTNPVGNGGYAATLNYFSNRYSATGESSVLDATALKVREIALSYTLPSKMLNGTGIESVKIGVNARNPFVLFGDPFKGKSSYSNKGYTDPEASNTVNISSNNSSAINAIGLSQTGQYPSTKTYGFSLNLTF